jgi:hypothetical protein
MTVKSISKTAPFTWVNCRAVDLYTAVVWSMALKRPIRWRIYSTIKTPSALVLSGLSCS